MTRRYGITTSAPNRVGGFAISGFGGMFLILIAVMASQDANPPLARVTILMAVAAAAIVGGFIVSQRRNEQLQVDLDARRATLLSSVRPAWNAPLDEIAPLVVTRVTQILPNVHGRTRIVYHVAAAGRPDLSFVERTTYPAARKAAWATARAWRVGLCTLDGRIRSLSELNDPRQRPPLANPAAPRPELPEDSGVTIESSADRTVLSSSVLPRGPEFPNIYLLVGAVMAGAGLTDINMQVALSDPAADPLRALGAAALAIAGGVMLVVFLRQGWQFMQPAELTIGDQFVWYKGWSLPTADVDEVVTVGSTLILAGARSIEIPPGFCHHGASGAFVKRVRHEIGRQASRTPRVR